MSLVLAVDPDGEQAEAIREVVGRQANAQLVQVRSAYAAVVAINRRVPDLVLLSEALGPKSQKSILDHFRSIAPTSDPQTLIIPDPKSVGRRPPTSSSPRSGAGKASHGSFDTRSFGDDIAACLGRALESRRADLPPATPLAPAATIARHTPVVPPEHDPVLEFLLRPPPTVPAGRSPEAPPALDTTPHAPTATLDTVPDAAPDTAPAVETPLVSNELLLEIADTPSAWSTAGTADDLDEDDVSVDLESSGPHDGRIDSQLHSAHIALVQAQAQATLIAELTRVRREAAEERAAEITSLQDEADARRQAEVSQARVAAESDARSALAEELGKARAEAERRLEAELERVRLESERRLATQIEEGEAVRVAEVARTRAAAEDAARLALENQIALIQAEGDARLTSELQRVSEETERARIREDAAARINAELAYAREDAEAARLAQQHAQAALEAAREAAARAAIVAAEEAAARAVDAKAERVRREAEARLHEELARVRAEAERELQQQREVERETAAAREAEALEARAVAEAAAAREREAEVARIQAEAEVRLREELARAREEIERTQLEGQAQLQQARLDAEREAYARAEAMLAAETARARQEADLRLEEELSRLRAEAEQSRQAHEHHGLDAEAAREAAAREARAQTEAALAREHGAEIARIQQEADARLQAELARVREEIESTQRAAQARLEAEREAHACTEATLQAESERARQAADRRLQDELARLRAETDEALRTQHDSGLDREAAREAADREARAQAGATLTREHDAEISRIQKEAEARLHAELTRVREDIVLAQAAEQARLDAEREAYARAEAMLAAETARARQEADLRLKEELSRLRAEAEQSRQAHEHHGLDAEAAREARAQTEADLAREHGTEIARIQQAADARLQAELARVREEIETTQRAAQARLEAEREAHACTEATLQAESERARQAADRRLQDELARLRAETDEALRTQHDSGLDREAAREAADREARAQAEATLTREHDAEISRIQKEAEARLHTELTRVREDIVLAQVAEQARLDAERKAHARAEAKWHAEAERARHAADRRLQDELARLRAEADEALRTQHDSGLDRETVREAAAREARQQTAIALTREHDAKIARIQQEADARLRAELARVREEIALTQATGQAQLEQARLDAEREARTRADEMLQVEIERAREEANARLATEIAAVRADETRRRNAELAEIRAHLAEAEEHAAEHARAATAVMLSSEVARATVDIPTAVTNVRPPTTRQTATTWATEVVMDTTLPLARHLWDRVPAYTFPTAAGILLIAGALGILDPISARRSTAPVASVTQAADTLANATSHVTRAVLRKTAGRKTDSAQPTLDEVAEATSGPPSDATVTAPGALTVLSRVPLDVEIDGRRVGSSENGEIALPPGRYDVRLVNARLDYEATVTVDVGPSAVTTHTAALPEGQLQIAAPPGSEIWIEGTRVGTAPLGAVAVAIGTREVVVKHPTFGEQTQFVEVRAGGVTTADIVLRETPRARTNDFPLPSLNQPGPTIR